MPGSFQGEIYAGLTAVCWTCSAICFEYAGRRIGSLVVNLLRLTLAAALLAILCGVQSGFSHFADATPKVWTWVAISGLMGFFVCDMCLFRAYILLGARRTMLIASLAPVFAAVLDYTLMHDPLTVMQLLGMALTLAGVAWVILERPPSAADAAPHSHVETRQGTVLALIAALGQALGASALKFGMLLDDGQQFDAVSASLIRIVAGTLCFAIFLTALRWGRQLLDGMRDGRAVGALSIGAVVGPLTGVTLFTLALQNASTGVVQTIVATIPVLLLPVAYFQKHEHIGYRAILGAIVAVAGVAVMSSGDAMIARLWGEVR